MVRQSSSVSRFKKKDIETNVKIKKKQEEIEEIKKETSGVISFLMVGILSYIGYIWFKKK